MCVTLSLDAFTSDGELAERGYEDPVIRDLSEAIETTDSALTSVRGFEYTDLLQEDGDLDGYDGDLDAHLGESSETYTAVLQANCTLYGAVTRRLEVLAREMGKDPEEVLHDF